jgi:glucan phosphoethanolaminetransferase (alkaline phosphatase superfamily)
MYKAKYIFWTIIGICIWLVVMSYTSDEIAEVTRLNFSWIKSIVIRKYQEVLSFIGEGK